MRLLTKVLPQSAFARSVLTLASGTVGAQVILIASSPILTRLYSAEDFGLLSVFLSMMGLIAAIAALRFEMAIPLPEDDRDAVALTATGGIVVLILSLGLLVAVLRFADELALQFNAPAIAQYLWLLPLAFFANGLFIVLNMLSVRHGRFGDMSKAKVLQSLTTVVTQIAGVACGGIVLIVGRVLGNLAAAAHLIRKTGPSTLSTIKTLEARELWRSVVTYRKFPLISTWAALASSIGASVPPLLFAASFGLEMAGFYAMTMMVMVVPMGIIGIAVQNAFYRKAVDAHRAGHLADLILAVHARLVLVMMPAFVLAAFVLPPLFVLVFGAAWELSSNFAVWILPWMFMQLTVAPCTGVYPILNRLGIGFLFDLSLAAAPFLAFLLAREFGGDALLAVQVLSALAATVYAVRVAVTLRLGGGHFLSGIAVLFRVLPIAALGGLPALWVTYSGAAPTILVLMLAVAGGTILAAVAIRWAWKRLPSMEPVTPAESPNALDQQPAAT